MPKATAVTSASAAQEMCIAGSEQIAELITRNREIDAQLANIESQLATLASDEELQRRVRSLRTEREINDDMLAAVRRSLRTAHDELARERAVTAAIVELK